VKILLSSVWFNWHSRRSDLKSELSKSVSHVYHTNWLIYYILVTFMPFTSSLLIALSAGLPVSEYEMQMILRCSLPLLIEQTRRPAIV
jgi:hypothetical protein